MKREFIFYGIPEMFFGIWIIFTGVVVLPLLIEVVREPTLARLIYGFATALCGIYFLCKGTVKLITNK